MVVQQLSVFVCVCVFTLLSYRKLETLIGFVGKFQN